MRTESNVLPESLANIYLKVYHLPLWKIQKVIVYNEVQYVVAGITKHFLKNLNIICQKKIEYGTTLNEKDKDLKISVNRVIFSHRKKTVKIWKQHITQINCEVISDGSCCETVDTLVAP